MRGANVRRSKHQTTPHNRERWLISYADFITLLFAFFTTLYAISVVDAVKAKKLVHSIRESFGEGILEQGGQSLLEGEAGSIVELEFPGIEERKARFEEVARRIESLPVPEGIAEGFSIRQNERGLVVTLAGSTLFSSGGDVLSDEAKEALRQVASVVEKLPNHIRIEGHSDSRNAPAGSTNWHLSAKRGIAALIELEKGGIASHRLSVASFGDQRPVVSNSSPEGQRMNRRVDIVVLRLQAPSERS